MEGHDTLPGFPNLERAVMIESEMRGWSVVRMEKVMTVLIIMWWWWWWVSCEGKRLCVRRIESSRKAWVW